MPSNKQEAQNLNSGSLPPELSPLYSFNNKYLPSAYYGTGPLLGVGNSEVTKLDKDLLSCSLCSRD